MAEQEMLAVERFNDKVIQRGDNECWSWNGAKDWKTGRGTFWFNGKQVKAPQIALILSGKSKPDGEWLACHHCDNPNCVNPNHLYWGTRSDNAQDLLASGNHWQKSRTHCANGHEFTNENTRIKRNGHRECRECHREQNRLRMRVARAALAETGGNL